MLLLFEICLSRKFCCVLNCLVSDVLVVPLRLAERVTDLTSVECADLMQVAQHVSGVIEKTFGGSSLMFCIQDGAAAGQTVKVLIDY